MAMNLYDTLKVALRGTPDEAYADDIFAKRVLEAELQRGNIPDTLRDRIQTTLSTPHRNPGDFLAAVRELNDAAPTDAPVGVGGSIAALRGGTTTQTDDDIFARLTGLSLGGARKSRVEEAADEPFTYSKDIGLMEASKPSRSVIDSLMAGWENDKGFVQATAGLALKGVNKLADSAALDAASATLLGWAKENFDKANTRPEAEGVLGFVQDTILQQVPTMALTLGAGWMAKTGAKMAIGTPVRAAVLNETRAKLATDLVAKNFTQEQAEAQARKLVTPELVDTMVDTVARRKLPFDAGYQQAAELLASKGLGKIPSAAADVAKAAMEPLKSKAALAIGENYAFGLGAAAGSFALNSGQVYQYLEDERAKNPDMGEITPADVFVAGAGMAALDSLPIMWFARKYGIMGAGDQIAKAMKEFERAKGTTKIKYALIEGGKDALKAGAAEGVTEGLQEVLAQSGRIAFINKWHELNDEQKEDVLPFLFNEEQYKNYALNAAGGFIVGGGLGGVGGAWNAKNKKDWVDAEVQRTAVENAQAALEKGRAEHDAAEKKATAEGGRAVLEQGMVGPKLLPSGSLDEWEAERKRLIDLGYTPAWVDKHKDVLTRAMKAPEAEVDQTKQIAELDAELLNMTPAEASAAVEGHPLYRGLSDAEKENVKVAVRAAINMRIARVLKAPERLLPAGEQGKSGIIPEGEAERRGRVAATRAYFAKKRAEIEAEALQAPERLLTEAKIAGVLPDLTPREESVARLMAQKWMASMFVQRLAKMGPKLLTGTVEQPAASESKTPAPAASETLGPAEGRQPRVSPEAQVASVATKMMADPKALASELINITDYDARQKRLNEVFRISESDFEAMMDGKKKPTREFDIAARYQADLDRAVNDRDQMEAESILAKVLDMHAKMDRVRAMPINRPVPVASAPQTLVAPEGVNEETRKRALSMAQYGETEDGIRKVMEDEWFDEATADAIAKWAVAEAKRLEVKANWTAPLGQPSMGGIRPSPGADLFTHLITPDIGELLGKETERAPLKDTQKTSPLSESIAIKKLKSRGLSVGNTVAYGGNRWTIRFVEKQNDGGYRVGLLPETYSGKTPGREDVTWVSMSDMDKNPSLVRKESASAPALVPAPAPVPALVPAPAPVKARGFRKPIVEKKNLLRWAVNNELVIDGEYFSFPLLKFIIAPRSEGRNNETIKIWAGKGKNIKPPKKVRDQFEGSASIRFLGRKDATVAEKAIYELFFTKTDDPKDINDHLASAALEEGLISPDMHPVSALFDKVEDEIKTLLSIEDQILTEKENANKRAALGAPYTEKSGDEEFDNLLPFSLSGVPKRGLLSRIPQGKEITLGSVVQVADAIGGKAREAKFEVVDSASKFLHDKINHGKLAGWSAEERTNRAAQASYSPDTNTIYLNRDLLTIEDAAAMIFHEHFGHGLFRSMVGDEIYNKIIASVKGLSDDTIIGTQTLGKIRARYREAYAERIKSDPKFNIDDIVAREVVPHLAEFQGRLYSRNPMSLMGRMFRKIARWLKDKLGMDYSINDIHDIMLKQLALYQKQGKAAPTVAPEIVAAAAATGVQPPEQAKPVAQATPATVLAAPAVAPKPMSREARLKKFLASGTDAELEASLKNDKVTDAEKGKIRAELERRAAGAATAPEFSIAGERANTGLLSGVAKAMETQGKSREDIWKETGWWRGQDGKWRFEIDDSKFKLRVKPDAGFAYKTLPFARMVDYPELLASYPDLKKAEVTVAMHPSFEQPSGTFSIGKGKPVIQVRGSTPEQIRSTMIHEVQHAIQDTEGFAAGSNLTDAQLAAMGPEEKQAALAQYGATPGEIESRLVERRLDMTPEQRKAEAPWVTEEKMLKEEGQPSFSLSDRDARHAALEARAKAGDAAARAEAEGMVREAAKEKGLSEKVYRGKGTTGSQNHSGGIYFTNSREVALFFADGKENQVSEHFLRLGRVQDVKEDTGPDAYDSLESLRNAESELRGSRYDTIRGTDLPDGPERSTVYIVKSPNQIKSADPFTYDSNGKLIPLSQRFDEKSPDIRFSLADRERQTAIKNIPPATEKFLADYAKDPTTAMPPSEPSFSVPADTTPDTTGANFSKLPQPADKRGWHDLTRMMAQIGNWAGSAPGIGMLRHSSLNKDISILRHHLMTAAALARHRPWTMGRLTEIATLRGEYAAAIKQEVVTDNNDYIVLPQGKRDAVDAMIVASDRDNFRLENKPAGWDEAQWRAYKAWGDSMDRSKQYVIRGFEEAIKFYEGIIAQHQEATPAGREMTETIAVKNARIKLAQTLEEKKMFEARKFYMPRIRKGDLVVEGKFKKNFTDKDGFTYLAGQPFRFHFDDHAYGERQANELVAKLLAEGNEIKETNGQRVVRQPKMLDTALMDANLYETEALLQQIGQEMGESEEAQKKVQELREAMKYVFYARGFRQHFIGRIKMETEIGPEVFRGYQEKNLHEVFAQYVGGLAGVISKADAGMKYRNLMLETDPQTGERLFDPRNRPVEYRAAQAFIRDQMRNSDAVDRLVGQWSGIAAHVFLGFRVSTALINGLTVHMFGSSMLHSKMKDANHPDYASNNAGFAKLTGGVALAHKDAMRFMMAKHTADKGGETLGAWAIRVGFDMSELRFLTDHLTIASTQTFANEVTEKILYGGSGTFTRRGLWSRYTKWSMKMMQTTEVAGRLGAMLSYHRAFKNMTTDPEKLARDSYQFSKDIHGTYERWNVPTWLKSDDPLLRFMKIPTFTFGTYIQNTYELLWHLAEKDKAALGWAFLMATMLGGFPLYKFVAFMSNAMGFTKDPTMDHEMNKLIGPTATNMLRTGIIFTPLGIDASGSTNLGMPAVATMAAVAAGKSDAFGDNIAVSTAKSFWNTGGAIIDSALGRVPPNEILKNFPIAAIRSVGKAYYIDPEAKGRKLLINGQPVELTAMERGQFAMGFTPDRVAYLNSQVFAVGKISKDLNAEKRALEEEFLTAKGLARAKVVRKINDFNRRLEEMKKEGGTMGLLRVRPMKVENIKPQKGIAVQEE